MTVRSETKSAQIRRLYALGKLSVKEIAVRVGCLPEYVRVVARQRSSGPSKAQRTYIARVRPDDLKRIGREAYHRVRANGLPVRDANLAALRARNAAVRNAKRAGEVRP